MSVRKIVLTGGPCGGKTESLELFKEKLKLTGKSIISIEETANSLLQLNYMPNINISTFDFQNLLFKIQFLKEYLNEKIFDIILCDRGLLDGKVYMRDDDFQKLLVQNRLEEKKIISTYDVALYFKSIAYEYPEDFMLKRVYESPEMGITRDKKCKEVWKDKIIPFNYDNSEGFEIKKQLIYNALITYLENDKHGQHFGLSDYYSKEYIAFMFNGIEKILNDNCVSNDIRNKTRRLVK